MNPPWKVNKTSNYNNCVTHERISKEVQDAIEEWSKKVTLVPTKNFRCYFISPKRIFQIWNAKLPDPDYRKGRRSGFRLVCFFLTFQNIIFLDLIERRNDLGGKNERPRDQQRYTAYLVELKKELLEVYENGNF